MKKDHIEYRFRIDAYTPETLPMARLAEYLAELAKLFGNQESVHLIDIEEGSTVLVQYVDFEAEPKVTERVRGVKTRTAPADAMSAYREIDRKLKQDNASAELETELGKIIEFPGRKHTPVSYGPFRQEGSLEGVPILVGGKKDQVSVHLEDETKNYICATSREIAKKISKHLFEDIIRVHGTSRWLRNEDGNWSMDYFHIKDFEILNKEPLTKVVAKLRSIQGSEWDRIDDPLAELDRLRHSDS